jgi:ATP-binding cassette subfamily F protein uup
MAINLTKIGDLWIFDEPTNDLDLETLQILEKKLKEFSGSIILIGHDRAFLSNVTNKIWLLEDQTIENFDGGYEQVEAYMEARELERQINQETPPKEKSRKTRPKKASFRDKQRVKFLEKEIPIWEEALEQTQEKLNAFDYSNMKFEDSQKLVLLNNQLEELENSILEGLEELEELQKLLSSKQ